MINLNGLVNQLFVFIYSLQIEIRLDFIDNLINS